MQRSALTPTAILDGSGNAQRNGSVTVTIAGTQVPVYATPTATSPSSPTTDGDGNFSQSSGAPWYVTTPGVYLLEAGPYTAVTTAVVLVPSSADLSDGATIDAAVTQVGTNTAAISSEVSRAEGAETTIAGTVTAETNARAAADANELARATGAESTLAANLTAETTRALAAEAAISAGLVYKDADAVATSNLTLSGLQTVDGVTLAAGERVLLVGQSAQSKNGLWLAQPGAWVRPADYATGTSAKGVSVFVLGGTANASSQWVATGTTALIIDTNAVVFQQASGLGEITVGAGLLKNGNQLSPDLTVLATVASLSSEVSRATAAELLKQPALVDVAASAPITAAQVLSAGGMTYADPTGGSFTVTLPAPSAGTVGLRVGIKNVAAATATTSLTVSAPNRLGVTPSGGIQILNGNEARVFRQATASGWEVESGTPLAALLPTLSATYGRLDSVAVNPRSYGAVGNARSVSDATVAAGALGTLTSATAAFTSADVGAAIIVFKGVSTTAHLVTTVASVVNATTVTLTTAALQAVSAVPMSVGTDDTAAINAAFSAATAAGLTVGFPAGQFIYLGSGWNTASPRVEGISNADTTIVLGMNNVISSSAVVNSLTLRNVATRFGLGAIHLSSTASNVNGLYFVDGCQFLYYMGACISHNSSDMPYWKIHHNQFQGANYTSTIGVALSGLTDLCEISNNAFTKNRVHIKGRFSANNLKVRDNDLIRLDLATDGYPRVDVWIVPQVTSNNSGQGLEITGNKLGNENVAAGDLRVLFADEDTTSGSDNGSYFPQLVTASAGYVYGAKIENTLIGGSNLVPYTYSMTPNVAGCSFAFSYAGTAPSYVLQYLTPPTTNDIGTENIFGSFRGPSSGEGAPPLQLSNALFPGYVSDPNYVLATSPTAARSGGASDYTDYVPLQTVRATALTVSNATIAGITDAAGGTDAVEATFTSATSGQVFQPISSPVVGAPCWVEFDLQLGTSSPMTDIIVKLRDIGSGATHWQRTCTVPAGSAWTRFRFPVTFRNASNVINLIFIADGSQTGSVGIGRIRCYQAREPVLSELLDRAVAWTAADSGLISWNWDPSFISAGIASTSGTLYLAQMKLPRTQTVTNVLTHVYTAGVSLTSGQCFAGLYQNGVLLGQTADQSTVWTSAGPKVMPLASPVTAVAGKVYVGLLTNGTTNPQFSRSGTGGGGSVGVVGTAYRYATGGTGLTTALPPGPLTLSQLTSAIWAGIS